MENRDKALVIAQFVLSRNQPVTIGENSIQLQTGNYDPFEAEPFGVAVPWDILINKAKKSELRILDVESEDAKVLYKVTSEWFLKSVNNRQYGHNVYAVYSEDWELSICRVADFYICRHKHYQKILFLLAAYALNAGRKDLKDKILQCFTKQEVLDALRGKTSNAKYKEYFQKAYALAKGVPLTSLITYNKACNLMSTVITVGTGSILNLVAKSKGDTDSRQITAFDENNSVSAVTCMSIIASFYSKENTVDGATKYEKVSNIIAEFDETAIGDKAIVFDGYLSDTELIHVVRGEYTNTWVITLTDKSSLKYTKSEDTTQTWVVTGTDPDHGSAVKLDTMIISKLAFMNMNVDEAFLDKLSKCKLIPNIMSNPKWFKVIASLLFNEPIVTEKPVSLKLGKSSDDKTIGITSTLDLAQIPSEVVEEICSKSNTVLLGPVEQQYVNGLCQACHVYAKAVKIVTIPFPEVSRLRFWFKEKLFDVALVCGTYWVESASEAIDITSRVSDANLIVTQIYGKV